MIIKTNFNGGLYGQIFTWIIEFLPYLKRNNIYPKWDMTADFYGKIFGNHLLLNYKPNHDNDDVVDFWKLKINIDVEQIDYFNQITNSNDCNFFKHHNNDFVSANSVWFSYFKFSDEIIEEVNNFMQELKGKTLGLHYRGTDKINTEGGYINIEIFKQMVDDYLSKNEINNIIIFTDERKTFNILKEYYNNYNIKYTNDFSNLSVDDILFINNKIYNFDLDLSYKQCLIDTLILSKCDVNIKTSSQFSAWSKIFNPNLETYRVSSFVHDWFPDSRIPIYKSSDENVNKILNNILLNESKKIN